MRANEAQTAWDYVPLRECGKWLSGGTPRTNESKYWGGDIPWITASSLHSFQIKTSERKLTSAGLENGSRLVPKGSILFVVRGMSLKTEFRVGIAQNPVAFGQDCKAIIPNNRLDSLFLAYAIRGKGEEILGLVDEAGHGTGRLQTDLLEKLAIPLPPLTEQRAIASVFGSLDDKIELNRRMNVTLEAMARALFQSWFVDFDPVRAKVDGRQPAGMDSATAALFPAAFQESPVGPIPKGWSAQRLPDAVEVNPRRTLKAGVVAPYLDMKNLPTQGHSAEEVIDREFSSGTKFQNGDTLLARITPCLENGKTGYVDFLEDGEVGWGSTEYIVLAPKPPLPPQFAYLLARSDALRAHAIQNMTGTSGRQRVPSECFNGFHLAVPTPQVARRFDEFTAPLMERIKANAKESRTLATLRNTLLPKLLSGDTSLTNHII